MTELYDRQKSLNLKIPDEVYIIGCGGVGTWLGILCAMVGVKTINLFDSDIVENHNRARLPFPEEWNGMKKTDALKMFINWIRPECTVYDNDAIMNETDLIAITSKNVFDCTDNAESQTMIFNYCKKNKHSYVKLGCNADHVTAISQLDSVTFTEVDPYSAPTPMYIVPPMLISLYTMWNVTHGNTDINYLKSVSNIFNA